MQHACMHVPHTTGAPLLPLCMIMMTCSYSRNNMLYFWRLQHSGASGQGENLAWGYPSVTAAVDAWYAENKAYAYGAPNIPSNFEQVGHFTQMVSTCTCLLALRVVSYPRWCAHTVWPQCKCRLYLYTHACSRHTLTGVQGWLGIHEVRAMLIAPSAQLAAGI